MTGEPPAPLDVRLALAAMAAWATVAAVLLAPPGLVWALLAGQGLLGGGAAVIALRTRRPGPGNRTAAGPTADGRLRALAPTVAAVALLACGLGSAAAIRAHHVHSSPIAGLIGQQATVELTATADAVPIGGAGPDRVLITATVTAVRSGPDRISSPAPVTVFAPADGWGEVLIGERLRGRAAVQAPDRADLTAAVLQMRGPPSHREPGPAVWRISGGLRDGLSARAERVLAPAEAALLPGLVLGDTSGMDEGAKERFAIAGLTHLTAVSGTHFALVCAAAAALARSLGPKGRAAVTVVVTVGFVIVVRPAPSVLRAALMGLIAVYALVSGRRRQALPALAAAVLGLLIVRPAWATAPGFVMSVAATAALVVIAPTWADRLQRWGAPRPVAEAVAVAAAAQVAVVPVLATISGYLGAAAVPANLVAIPALAPALLLGLAALLLGPWWPAAADLMVRTAGPALWWLSAVARWASGLPGADLAVPVGGVGVLLVLGGIAAAVLWMSSATVRGMTVAVLIGCAAVWPVLQWVVPRGSGG